jgi:hypothetical protein
VIPCLVSLMELSSLSLETIVEHIGNVLFHLIYFQNSHSLHACSWITVVAFYPSLFGYAFIAEQPYTKTSLPNIKSWPKGMWIVFIIAVG